MVHNTCDFFLAIVSILIIMRTDERLVCDQSISSGQRRADTDMIDELEDTLDKDVRAIGVDHEVSEGKQVTFPLTLEFLMTSYAQDPIWKISDMNGQDAVRQMHAMLSRNHQGIGENGLEDVQLAAVQHSLSVKVLEYLKERAKKKGKKP